MSLVVRAFPLRASVDDVHVFAAAVDKRRAEADRFYRQFGVSHESWHLQQTPNGPMLICITKVDDAATAAPRYAESASEFDAWFKKQVFELSGVNPDEQPLGPPTTQVFVWSDEQREKSNLCA